MRKIAYTVTASLPDAAMAEAYIGWLREGHVEAVLAGGALEGQIVLLEGPGPQVEVETRYTFAGRGAFEAYERDHAPGLRAEGLGRFGPERGVRFARRVGEIVELS